MPVPSQLGVFASGSSGGGGGGAAFVVAGTYDPTGSTQSVSFSGASAGNLALIFAVTSGPITAPGWAALTPYSWATEGFIQSILWKVLSSGDISTGSVTVSGVNSNFPVLFAAYSGASTPSVVSTGDVSSDGPLTIPGFTKAAGSKGIVTYMMLFQARPGTLVQPGLATMRIPTYSTSFFMAALADILPSSSYTNGSSLVWTGAPTFTVEQVAQAVELT